MELACLNFESMLTEVFEIGKALFPKEAQKGSERFRGLGFRVDELPGSKR